MHADLTLNIHMQVQESICNARQEVVGRCYCGSGDRG